jgi:hypothetical protein
MSGAAKESESTQQSTADEYEFTKEQNDVVRDLANTVSITGLVLMALGIVALVYAGVFITGNRTDPTPLVLAAFCAPMVIAGFWLRSTAEPLLKIVDTQGRDITNLVDALKEFRRVFALQRTGFAIALVFAIGGVLIRAMH